MSELAWHFVGDTLLDGRPVPADGEPLIHDGPVEMCESGLHASRLILDALQYAPGDTVCRVECARVEAHSNTKLVCRQRTILWRVDGTGLLREFARRCALDVADLRSAQTVVRGGYLRTGDDALENAARTAALDARVAAWDAAREARVAAWDAARAARVAAWDAALGARVAAWDAALDARNAAWDAARAMQNRRLTAMVCAARKLEGGDDDSPTMAACARPGPVSRRV